MRTAAATRVQAHACMRLSMCPHPLAVTQVLDAVPWVAPRPLYLLATEQREQPSASAAAAAAVRFGADAAPGQTYTLRTRVAQDGMEDELSRLVLRRRAADGSNLIRCRCAKGWVCRLGARSRCAGWVHAAEGMGRACLLWGRQRKQKSIIRLSVAVQVVA